MKRVIQNKILDKIALEMIDGRIKEGDKLKVGYTGKEVWLKV